MPGESGALWYDDDAGPMVRPYTVTRGRTVAAGPAPRMDVIAVVSLTVDPAAAAPGAPPPAPGAAAADGSAADTGPPGGSPPGGSPPGEPAEGAAPERASPRDAGEDAPGAVEDGADGAAVGASAGGAPAGGAPAEAGAAAGGAGGAEGRDAGGAGGSPRAETLGEEHLTLLAHCTPGPLSVADLAAEADLPLGVVRVLLADLVDLGRVRITRPVAPAELPDSDLLHHLITALRSL